MDGSSIYGAQASKVPQILPEGPRRACIDRLHTFLSTPLLS